MGLWLILFNHYEWEHLHSNCSKKTVDEWNASGSPNLFLGVLYTLIGVIFEILYVPFMIVMTDEKFWQHSCYKFMFLLGIVDMIVLPFVAIVGGIQCALGLHFCAFPNFFYIVGSIGNFGWFTLCTICIILGINRFTEMVVPSTAKLLFDGKRVYIWMLVPLVDSLFSMAQIPVLYNNKFFAYFFDPFYGTDYGGNLQFYDLTYAMVHNITVVVLLGLIYSSLCLVLIIRTKISKNTTLTSNVQKLMTIQSLCICIEIWISAVVYIVMNFVSIPEIFIVLTHISWILTHADNPVVYLILNKSLRKAVFNMIRNIIKHKSITPLITAILPVSFTASYVILRVHTLGVDPLIMSAVGWITAINPISAILFISLYRMAVFRGLCFHRNNIIRASDIHPRSSNPSNHHSPTNNTFSQYQTQNSISNQQDDEMFAIYA